MRLLSEAGVPSGAVMDSVDLFASEHLRARGMVAEVDHPVRGRVVLPGNPIKMHGGAQEVPLQAAPVLGANNDEVLASLGYSADDIATMRAERVI